MAIALAARGTGHRLGIQNAPAGPVSGCGDARPRVAPLGPLPHHFVCTCYVKTPAGTRTPAHTARFDGGPPRPWGRSQIRLGGRAGRGLRCLCVCVCVCTLCVCVCVCVTLTHSLTRSIQYHGESRGQQPAAFARNATPPPHRARQHCRPRGVPHLYEVKHVREGRPALPGLERREHLWSNHFA